MKIGHLIHLDGDGGGPEAVLNLVRGLRESGADQVVLHGGTGRVAATCDELGVPRVRLPIDRKATLVHGFVRLVLALRRTRPDVLLMQGQWGGPIGAMAAALAGVKTIYIAQWPAFYTDWTPFRAWRNAWAEWIPCRLACRVIVLTPSVYYQYLHRGWAGEDKLLLLPNVFRMSGVPTLDDAARVRREQGWSADAVHVVSVGRLADQKRVDWLLNAWPEVQHRCPAARLWIVGDGAERARLEMLAGRLGITATCTFLGARPRGIEFMAASDIVVMTSLYESFGFVPLEAKACGRPVIANAVDGVRDNVRDGVDGYLVAPADPAALARRLVEMIENPNLRRRMGEAGAAAMADVDPRKIVARYLELIEDVHA
jgi:glycosyltransferase involved in cell wall biosynthesis